MICIKYCRDWFRGFELSGYHVLNILDVFKESKQLVIFWNVTRNSDSWFACDSELFFSVAIYLIFQEGCCRVEPQIIEYLTGFFESVQVRDRFSHHISHSEEKCSAIPVEKPSFLDTHDKRYFWPRNKSVRTTGPAVLTTRFQIHFAWRQGGNL